MRNTLRIMFTIVWYSILFALAFVVAMLASALGTIDHAYLLVFTKVASLFAMLGALYGTIIALDPAAPRLLAPSKWLLQVEAPILRTVLCGLLGGAVVWNVSTVNSSSPTLQGLTFGTGIGAIAGWFGWRWARYIDF